MSAALIIGGTGFLGRVLADRARDAGLEVVVFAPDANPGAGVAAIRGDVLSGQDVSNALDIVRPQVVFHLAAFGVGGLGLIASALLHPVEATQVNVIGFVTACQLAAKHQAPRFVWSSSTSVYGTTALQGQDPLDENVTPRPDTIYGATKLACEQIAEPLIAGTSMQAVGLRFPGIYGAGRYPGALGAFTDFVADVASDVPASFVASERSYDWIHVQDAADALLVAATATPRRTIYNVVGHRSTMDEMARAVALHATNAVDVSLGPAEGKMPALMDGSAFADEMSFKPRFDLLAGAEQYVTEQRTMGLPIPTRGT